MTMQDREGLFTWKDGLRHFRGLPVEEHVIPVAGRNFRIASMRDAAGLLDDPEFGQKFVELDVAPYGLELWPAAGMMAKYILEGEPGNARAALDLGCGLALVSMAAKLAAWRITAGDNDETALQFAKYNTDLNNICIDEYLVLDWHHPPADRKFERVFGADILYQRVDHLPILECIKKILAPSGLAAISDPCRSVAHRIPELAEEAGFSVDVIPTKGFSCTGQGIEGRVFELRLK